MDKLILGVINFDGLRRKLATINCNMLISFIFTLAGFIWHEFRIEALEEDVESLKEGKKCK